MLPEYISENIASLKLNEIRPAISVKVEVTNEFKILNSEIILAEIRVTNKICYEEIDTILNSDETDEISQLIKIMQKFSEVLLENRLENGASLITRKEPTIKVKDNEIYFSIHEDSLSYKMIAEFMIFTNFVIADFANKKGIPIIYKTQDYIDDFNDYSLVRMTEYNPITFRKIIRKMKKSDFSVYPGKHSSLGVELYTQCSSPLRRFHDLVIQRQIEAYLYNEKLPYSGEEILELLVQAEYITDIVKRVCSESEKFWILKYFEKYLIENDFTATIIEKNKKGDYIVELDDYYVIGKILDENNLNIGDKIHIQISKLLPEQYILYFRLIE
jgi:exoribonuclease-2